MKKFALLKKKKKIFTNHSNSGSALVIFRIKDRHIDQWNRIEHPDMDLHLCGQLIFSKGIKECQSEENRLFKKCFWNNYISTWKTNELLSLFTPYTNINSK